MDRWLRFSSQGPAVAPIVAAAQELHRAVKDRWRKPPPGESTLATAQATWEIARSAGDVAELAPLRQRLEAAGTELVAWMPGGVPDDVWDQLE